MSLMKKENKMNKNNFFYNEIFKFSCYSTDWWNKNGVLKTLHQINPLRLKYILKKSHGLHKKRVLDIGCGGGILSESMAYNGAIVTGLDICKKSLEIANLHANKKNIKINYLLQTAESHSKKFKKYYDVITCMEMLEHVPYPASIIKSCSKMLKPYGNIFVSTINKNLKSYLFAIIMAEYILNMIPLGTHNFKKFIRPSDLSNWMDKYNFFVNDIIGIKYNIFNKKFFLSRKIDVNYILQAYLIK